MFEPMLLIFLACTPTSTEKPDSRPSQTTDSPTEGPADSTPESSPDSEKPASTHYMSTTAGTVTPTAGVATACAGEAHLNFYPEEGTLLGFCNCLTDSESTTLAGSFTATVVGGAVSGSWEADNTVDAVTISFTGSLDETTLHVDLAGSGGWVSFVGTVDGTAVQ